MENIFVLHFFYTYFYKMKKRGLIFIVFVFLFSCKDEIKNNTKEDVKTVSVPDFNADTAFAFIEKQVAFGPRVPGSAAQNNCAAWLETEMKKYCDTVIVQKATVLQPVSNIKYPSINLIGSINPQAPARILILAHWDSRPWADEDTKNQNKAIDAADDGGSGVAVMLEMMRMMKTQKPNDLGIDFLFVDAEDVGKTEWTEQSYCLGTQHWAKNLHIPGYTALFGICLDMVGAKGATFPLEGFSKQFAADKQKLIWDMAIKSGYGNYFINTDGGSITDDHLVVNEFLNIPCVDIINLSPVGSFGKHWHTHDDNISVIDKNTLKAVGQTVMNVIYNY